MNAHTQKVRQDVRVDSSAAWSLRWSWFKVFRGKGFLGVRLRRLYVTFRSSEHAPLPSERNRDRTRVCPLPNGWRIVARWDIRV